jgi:hypothetical protein
MGCGSSVDTSYVKKDLNIWRGKLKVELKDAALHKEIQWIGK